MRILTTMLLLFWVSACSTGTELARDQAKGVVNGVVENRFPGVDATPVTDCIIDNASGSEIFEIAGAAVTGVTEQTVVLIFEIAGRQETINCFANSLGPMLIAKILMGA